MGKSKLFLTRMFFSFTLVILILGCVSQLPLGSKGQSMHPGPPLSGCFCCCGPRQMAHQIGSCIVMFQQRMLSIIPQPLLPGFVLRQMPLNGFSITALRKVMFLTQFISGLGGTVPMVRPTPNRTVMFSISMFSVQLTYPSLQWWAGLGTTTSSQFWQVMLNIWKFLPLGSMPSVFRGNIGTVPIRQNLLKISNCAVVLTFISRLQIVTSMDWSILK